RTVRQLRESRAQAASTQLSAADGRTCPPAAEQAAGLARRYPIPFQVPVPSHGSEFPRNIDVESGGAGAVDATRATEVLRAERDDGAGRGRVAGCPGRDRALLEPRAPAAARDGVGLPALARGAGRPRRDARGGAAALHVPADALQRRVVAIR